MSARIRDLVDLIGASRKTSVFASIAVVLSAVLAFFATLAGSESNACDVNRELRLASGSPAMQVARQGLIESYGAAAYFDLAQRSSDPVRKRELTYEAIIRVNKGILVFSKNDNLREELWDFPTDAQINRRQYFLMVWEKLARSDYDSLRGSLLGADEQMSDTVTRQRECDQVSQIGRLLQFLALLFTILSVSLIILRERHRDA